MVTEQRRYLVFSNDCRLYLYTEDGWTMVWCDFTTENEPGNMRLFKIYAKSLVVLGCIGFHGIGDLAAADGTMVSTTIQTFLD